MSHQIVYREFGSKKTQKAIEKEMNSIAEHYSDYHDGLASPIVFKDKCADIKDRETAERFIENWAEGKFYPQLAVRYQDGRKKTWLVRIEFHV